MGAPILVNAGKVKRLAKFPGKDALRVVVPSLVENFHL